MKERLKDVIKDYKFRYGNSEFEQQGYNVHYEYYGELSESGVSIEEIKKNCEPCKELDIFLQILKTCKKDESIVYDSYVYSNNIVRV